MHTAQQAGMLSSPGDGSATIPQCDLILVTWNKLSYTKACLESLLRHTPMRHRVLIVDNGSDQETITFLDQLEAQHRGRVVTLKQGKNTGWVRAVNEGWRHSQAPYVCMLNNDLVMTPGWLEAMLAVAEADARIGLVNPTYNRSGEPMDVFLRRVGGEPSTGIPYTELNECNGACLLVRREVREAIGGLDNVYGLGGFDDFDYSRRAQVAGFRCVRAQDARVFHWENVTVNSIPTYWSEDRRRNERHFVQQWGERKQIAWVLMGTDDGGARRQIEQGLALGRLGLRVHLWALLPRSSPLRDSAGRWSVGLAEHNNLKWTLWPVPGRGLVQRIGVGWLAGLAAINGFSRRWKRSTQQVRAYIAPSRSARRWLKWLRWLHGAPVYQGAADCPLIAREVGWACSIDEPLWGEGEAPGELKVAAREHGDA